MTSAPIEAESILVLNQGSSTLKFAVLAGPRIVSGVVENSSAGAELRFRGVGDQPLSRKRPETLTPGAAAGWVFDVLDARGVLSSIIATGHRMVHGGPDFVGPSRLDPHVRDRLRRLIPLAPLHQASGLEVADAAIARLPYATHVACFDTAFHHTQPRLARLYALPRHLIDRGCVAYGFHGLSYEHVAKHLRRLDPHQGGGRAIVAHLGSGASLCALRNGVSIATTMGFSTLDGIPMSTRPGAIDPGLILHLLQQQGLAPDMVSDLLYHQSGLLGLSGESGDMRVLLASSSAEASEAIDVFVYRVALAVGSLAAALGGLDTLVFTGGVGEGCAEIRSRIAERTAWLGATLDPSRNSAHGEDIGSGQVRVLIVPADEEAVIAEQVSAMLTVRTSCA